MKMMEKCYWLDLREIAVSVEREGIKSLNVLIKETTTTGRKISSRESVITVAKLVTEKATIEIKKRMHTIALRTGSQEIRVDRLLLIRMVLQTHYLWTLTPNAVCTECVKNASEQESDDDDDVLGGELGETKHGDHVTGMNGKQEKSTLIAKIPGTVCDKHSNEIRKETINEVIHVPTSQYNLFSATKLILQDYSMVGNKDCIVLSK
eukprot:3128227-Ditylum_brightwellii.AAC.1